AQVVHNDMNPANVLVEPGRPDRMAGIIDFGDMLHAPLIVDVAVAASYLRTSDADVLKWIAELVAGYHQISALDGTETDLLYDLISTRLAATVAILHWRVTQRGQGDEYLGEAELRESSAGEYLVRLRALTRDEVSERLRQA
ncbi:MAG: phosphotransferase, partial [Woeseia sp.]